MIPVKPGELVISGSKNKIQFLELNTKKLKEIIDIKRNIYFDYCNLYMINISCFCVVVYDNIMILVVDYIYIVC